MATSIENEVSRIIDEMKRDGVIREGKVTMHTDHQAVEQLLQPLAASLSGRKAEPHQR